MGLDGLGLNWDNQCHSGLFNTLEVNIFRVSIKGNLFHSSGNFDQCRVPWKEGDIWLLSRSTSISDPFLSKNHDILCQFSLKCQNLKKATQTFQNIRFCSTPPQFLITISTYSLFSKVSQSDTFVHRSFNSKRCIKYQMLYFSIAGKLQASGGRFGLYFCSLSCLVAGLIFFAVALRHYCKTKSHHDDIVPEIQTHWCNCTSKNQIFLIYFTCHTWKSCKIT